MRKTRKNTPAFTGTTTRMKSLPYAPVSGIENFNLSNQEYISIDSHRRKVLVQEDLLREQESLTRKCVYTYEDKYAFSRIIYSDSLVFDSHFESGNLHSAFRVLNTSTAQSGGGVLYRKHTYDLYLHNDLYTSGNTQWYYFRVSNIRAGLEVTFNIKNFQKVDSLYNDGMRPLFFSTQGGRGWERCGEDVRYYSTIRTNDSDNPGVNQYSSLPALFTLSFTHTFDCNDDVCYFAYCLPYTYTDLQKYIFSLQSNPRNRKILRRRALCKTIAGNSCDILTITAPASSPEQLNLRVVVILTARVHPGESNSSWIMHGVINFLTSSAKEAAELRELYIFKIIPMLNPDGVINGNYRTSLSGADLNRKWSNPDPNRHPTIFHTKKLIKLQKRIRTVGFILDMHGHSRKKGIFVYGCVPDKRLTYLNNCASSDTPKVTHVAFNGGFSVSAKEPIGSQSYERIDSKSTATSLIAGGFSKARMVTFTQSESAALLLCGISSFAPWLTAPPLGVPSGRDVVSWKVNFVPRVLQIVTPFFSLESCRYFELPPTFMKFCFKMHKSKAGTMRIVAYSELGIDSVYTVEASLAGSDRCHFSYSDLMQMGQSICCGLLAAYPSVGCSTNTRASTFSVPGIDDEVELWRKFYSPRDYSLGAGLMSEAYLNEMINGTDELYTDDSDNDTVALERASLKARRTSNTNKTKASKKKVTDKVGSDGSVVSEKVIADPSSASTTDEKRKQSKKSKEVSNVTESAATKTKESIIVDKASDSTGAPKKTSLSRKQVPKPPSKKALELSVVGSRAEEAFPLPVGLKKVSDSPARRIHSAPISPNKTRSRVEYDPQCLLYLDDDMAAENFKSREASIASCEPSHFSQTAAEITAPAANPSIPLQDWLHDINSNPGIVSNQNGLAAKANRTSMKEKSDRWDTADMRRDVLHEDLVSRTESVRIQQDLETPHMKQAASSPKSPFSLNYQSDDSRVWSSVVCSYLDLFPDSNANKEKLSAAGGAGGAGGIADNKEWQAADTTNSKMVASIPTTVKLSFEGPIVNGDNHSRPVISDNKKIRRPQSAGMSSSRPKSASSFINPMNNQSGIEFSNETNAWLLGPRGNVVISSMDFGSRDYAVSNNIGNVPSNQNTVPARSVAVRSNVDAPNDTPVGTKPKSSYGILRNR